MSDSFVWSKGPLDIDAAIARYAGHARARLMFADVESRHQLRLAEMAVADVVAHYSVRPDRATDAYRMLVRRRARLNDLRGVVRRIGEMLGA